MRWLWRLLVMAFALPIAITASLTVLVVACVLDPVMATFAGTTMRAGFYVLLYALFDADDPGLIVESAATGLGRLAFSVLVVPPLFVALTSEVIGARSLAWHAGATGLLTALLPWLSRTAEQPPTAGETHITLVLGLLGATAGFVYWLIAGRGAGAPPTAAGERD